MDSTAIKYNELSLLLSKQSSVAHSLMVNYDAPVFSTEWAEESLARFYELQRQIDIIKKELDL